MFQVAIIVGHALDPISIAALEGKAELGQAASDLSTYLENFPHIEEVMLQLVNCDFLKYIIINYIL